MAQTEIKIEWNKLADYYRRAIWWRCSHNCACMSLLFSPYKYIICSQFNRRGIYSSWWTRPCAWPKRVLADEPRTRDHIGTTGAGPTCTTFWSLCWGGIWMLGHRP